MAWGVARRREDGDAAVAEDVEVALELADRSLGLEGRLLVGREGKVESGFWISSVESGNMSTLPSDRHGDARPRQS